MSGIAFWLHLVTIALMFMHFRNLHRQVRFVFDPSPLDFGHIWPTPMIDPNEAQDVPKLVDRSN